MNNKKVVIIVVVITLLIVGGLLWYYFSSNKLKPLSPTSTPPWGPVTGSHAGTGTGTPGPTGPVSAG